MRIKTNSLIAQSVSFDVFNKNIYVLNHLTLQLLNYNKKF